jgi:signal transduction histidine kinase
VVLSIEDNGIGISEDELPRIFDKGFTGTNGRKYGKSTGMGLYICKKLCDKLGLLITSSSRIGEGTAMIIAFPKSSMVDIR